MKKKVLVIGFSGIANAVVKALFLEGCDVIVAPGNAWSEGFCKRRKDLDYDSPNLVEEAVKMSVDAVFFTKWYKQDFSETGIKVFGFRKGECILELDREFGRKLAGSTRSNYIVLPKEVDVLCPGPKWGKRKIASNLFNTFFAKDKYDILRRKEDVFYEHIEGTEIAVTWMQNKSGIRAFHTNFEYKRLCSGNVGILTGEMGTLIKSDVSEFMMDNIVVPLAEVLRDSGYVGMIDANFIWSLRDGKFYFLEWTARSGYPTMQISLPMICNPYEFLFEEDYPEFVNPWSCGVLIVTSSFPYFLKTKGSPDDNYIGDVYIDSDGFDNFTIEDAQEVSIVDKGMFVRMPLSMIGVAYGLGQTREIARSQCMKRARMICRGDMFFRDDVGKEAVDKLWIMSKSV